MPSPWKTAWITGASSGMGRELALMLAQQGVRVAASARSGDQLAELARLQKGIAPLPLDVTDAHAVTEAVHAVEGTLGPPDLAILCAGVFERMTVRSFSAAKAERSMAVNYQGIVNAIEALLPGMLARKQGHIALVASIAGYRGLPPNSAYGPTKAAIINLAESLRNDLADSGITLSVICPGYVDTPMTQGSKLPMPFKVSVEDAARIILRGLERRTYEISFPWQLVAATRLAQVLPNRLFFWYARTLLAPPKKP